MVESIKTPGVGGGAGVFSDRKVSYTYDGLNRLLAETVDEGNNGPDAADWRDSYSYDLTANRLGKSHDAGNNGVMTDPADETITYRFGTNKNDQLQSETSSLTGATTYGYDANGSLTTKTAPPSGGGAPVTTNYAYDLRNRLEKVDVNGNTSFTDAGDVKYAYDSEGHHVSKEVIGGPGVGGTTKNLIDTSNPTGYAQTLEEQTTPSGSSNPTLTSYLIDLWVLGQSAAGGSGAPPTPLYLQTDPKGHTRQVTDAAGAVLAQYTHDAFGNALNYQPETALTAHLIADGTWDPTTRFTKMGIRDLMTASGRWSSADPTMFGVGDLSDWNRYVFVGGNPGNLRDPTGRFSVSELVTVAGNISTRLANIANVASKAYRAVDTVSTVLDYVSMMKELVSGISSGSLLQMFTEHLSPWKALPASQVPFFSEKFWSASASSFMANSGLLFGALVHPSNSKTLLSYLNKGGDLKILIQLPTPGKGNFRIPLTRLRVATGLSFRLGSLGKVPVMIEIGAASGQYNRALGIALVTGSDTSQIHQVIRQDWGVRHSKADNWPATWNDLGGQDFHYHILDKGKLEDKWK